MAFRFDERMRHDYWADGYVVFREVVPASLVRDLRVQIDKAREYAHRERGPQAQRLQPVVKYAEVLDQGPFRDYNELPALHEAVTRLLGPDYRHSHLPILGILVEPAAHSWIHGWHRDGLVEVPPGARDDELRAMDAGRIHDPRVFNQVNCAIYYDSSTWFVPGSHLRSYDLPGEVYGTPTEPTHLRKSDDVSDAEFERLCLEQCRQFPGAVQMHLAAGDYMLYRNNAWHCGNYLRYQPRGTIHDSCVYVGDWSADPLPDWGQAKRDAIARMQAREAAAGGS